MHVHVQPRRARRRSGSSRQSSLPGTTGWPIKIWVASYSWWWTTIRKFGMPGAATSELEITNISRHGFWLLLDGRELFLPFEEFPWFKQATVGAILLVERPTPGHLHWPELDVDLAVDSIEHPERYPLKSQL
jgi:hypothetical protein